MSYALLISVLKRTFGRIVMLNLFRIVSAILFVFCSLAASSANSQKQDVVLRSLLEKCDLAICWLGNIKPDSDGAAPEKWINELFKNASRERVG